MTGVVVLQAGRGRLIRPGKTVVGGVVCQSPMSTPSHDCEPCDDPVQRVCQCAGDGHQDDGSGCRELSRDHGGGGACEDRDPGHFTDQVEVLTLENVQGSPPSG